MRAKTDTRAPPCFADPTEIEIRSDDAILLTMKTQHTLAALERLRAAGVREQPIFCVQNGIANERLCAPPLPGSARRDGDDAGQLCDPRRGC
jgi:ketopantoate reductase